MHIYLVNNPAKVHSDLIWNDEALGFYEQGHPNNKNNKNSSDKWSVTDPKIYLQHDNVHSTTFDFSVISD